eukprot:4893412-Pyramimonas_sp.AAC.1
MVAPGLRSRGLSKLQPAPGWPGRGAIPGLVRRWRTSSPRCARCKKWWLQRPSAAVPAGRWRAGTVD